MIDAAIKPCTVCGWSQSRVLLADKSDGRGPGCISLHKCAHCGCVFLGEYPAGYDEQLYDYYEAYRGKSRSEVFNPLTEKSYLRVLDRISKVTPGRKVLDVGCGNGDFVDVAARVGWNVEGIELAQPAVEIAQSFGLPVRQVDFYAEEIRPSSRDVVTLFEVIEHLPQPGRFLARAEEVIRPGGVIYLTTPNFASLDRRVLGADWRAINREHLTYFTPASLRVVVERHTSLEVLRIETRNLSVAALRAAASRAIRRSAAQPVDAGATTDAEVRESIEGSAWLQLAKASINVMLNFSRLGNTIVALLRRRA